MKDIKNPNKTTQRRKVRTLPLVKTVLTSEVTVLILLSCTIYKGQYNNVYQLNTIKLSFFNSWSYDSIIYDYYIIFKLYYINTQLVVLVKYVNM